MNFKPLILICVFLSAFGCGISKDVKYSAVSAEIKSKADALEIYDAESPPKKKYKVLSPLSYSESSAQKSFKYMKIDAAKMGADAIVEASCLGQSKSSARFNLATANANNYAQCQGVAVKWH